MEREDESGLRDNERGAGMMEYALLASLLGVVVIVAVTFLGQQVKTTFAQSGQAIASGVGAP